MKVGVIIFHKNIFEIYRKRWVHRCLETIKNQTFQDFKVFELCYSDTKEQLWENSVYYHKPMENHIFAMNFLLDEAFKTCDVVFNVNLDDCYNVNRFRSQLDEVNKGSSLVGSNFQLIMERNQFIENQIIKKVFTIDPDDNCDVLMNTKIVYGLDAGEEQRKNHNILAHPVICYTKGFWERNKYYKVDEIGYEDFNMWKKATANSEKISIVNETLLYYRISSQQISSPKANNPNSARKP